MNNTNQLNQELKKNFIQLLESKSGIIFDTIKEDELYFEISRLMKKYNISSFNLFYEFISQNEKVLKELVNFFTINETFFFRVPEQLDALRYNVLPEILRKKKKKKIKIWSAGCSTGEEPYSLAITLLESGFYNENQIEIIGTDINEDVLNIAKRGEYSGRTLNYVSDYFLNKYFTKVNNKYKINDCIRNIVKFKYLNLINDFTSEDFLKDIDIIFFRNVLIYFDLNTTKTIIKNFYKILNNPGYLFLGPSETLFEISSKFEVKMLENTFYYKKIFKDTLIDKNKIDSKKNNKEINSNPFKNNLNKDKKSKKYELLECTYNKFQELLNNNEPKEIELTIENFLKKEPFSKKCLILKFLYLLNNSNENNIKEFYNKIEDTMPLLPEIYYLMGLHLKSKSKYTEAIVEFKKDLFINHNYILPRIKLLEIYRLINDENKARLEAKNIITMVQSGKFKLFENINFDDINIDKFLNKKWFRELIS